MILQTSTIKARTVSPKIQNFGGTVKTSAQVPIKRRVDVYKGTNREKIEISVYSDPATGIFSGTVNGNSNDRYAFVAVALRNDTSQLENSKIIDFVRGI